MRFTVPFKFLLLAAFTLLLNHTIVLAGEDVANGSGDGGHSHTTTLILIAVAIAAIFGTLPFLTKIKTHFAAKIMTHASHKDTFWNTKDLKKHAEKIFYQIQEALGNRSLAKIKDAVDPQFYAQYNTLFTSMIERHEKTILSQIHIDEIHIIGCQDYIDDSKDRYIAYLQGRLLNYVINDTTEEIIKNSSKTLSNFSESYHFVRNNNNWILEKIDTNVTMQDILQTKNFIEK